LAILAGFLGRFAMASFISEPVPLAVCDDENLTVECGGMAEIRAFAVTFLLLRGHRT